MLIQAPYALDCFEDNHLVLPLAVLEELDGLKKADGERGANARAVIRALEGYRCRGGLLAGVPIAGGGTLRVEAICSILDYFEIFLRVAQFRQSSETAVF